MPLNIIRGLFRGATRGVMTGKRANKNFYKGKRSLILINVVKSINSSDRWIWLRIAVLGSNTKQKRLQESNGQNFGSREALN